MSFGMNSGSTSHRLSFFDDKSKLQHKQENPTNSKCKESPRKAKKQAKGFCLLKKLGLK